MEKKSKSELLVKLGEILTHLDDSMFDKIKVFDIVAWITEEPVDYRDRFSGSMKELSIGDKWGDLFDCGWFRFRSKIPHEFSDQVLVATLDISGEMCIVDHGGYPLRGLTNISSEFDRRLGEPGKKVMYLDELYEPDQLDSSNEIEIWAEAGCNDLFGYLQDDGKIIDASLALLDLDIQSLYFDYEFIIDFVSSLDKFDLDPVIEQDFFKEKLERNISEWSNDDLRNLRDNLLSVLNYKNKHDNLEISAIGHSHIDLAWLWPIRETKRKGIRTFSTVVSEMKRYPDYIYGASQPQLYDWIKENQPQLYQNIQELVQERRIEPLGSLWVESDVNLISGESIIRQILYGKQFFKNEFNTEIDFVWLPDTFGFPASLPQIFISCGMKYFVTQKLSWNSVNKFPHHSFYWRGIDGSEILSHLLPEETYNGPALPRSLMKIEDNYSEADISNHALMVYGIGDGGGGPGIEHLERINRFENINGMDRIKQTQVSEFFKKWTRDKENFPIWDGELYLERHQGTYTTNALNKWFNRKIELLLRELEILQSFYYFTIDHEFVNLFDKKKLDTIWKEVLLYQFHDILPGSSIKRVYDESISNYQRIYKTIEDGINTLLSKIVVHYEEIRNEGKYLLFNSLSWERETWVTINNSWYKIRIPGLSHQLIEKHTQVDTDFDLEVSEFGLSNDILEIKFENDGSIVSIFDKLLGREIIEKGTKANQFAIYEDTGNAWDFPNDYHKQIPKRLTLNHTETRIDGPKAILVQYYEYNTSSITQEIVLTEGDRLIEFNTKITWKEPETMLRTSFPCNIMSREATFDIQFGYFKRATHNNTSWDTAKIEVVGQKYVDMSQFDYGIALLNDSKYGLKVKDNIIDMNILRSVPFAGYNTAADRDLENPQKYYTDIRDHNFKYALLPHQGNHIQGGVIQRAYEYNIDIVHTSVSTDLKTNPNTSLFVINQDAIIVETIKISEDENGIIIRFYEAYSSSTSINIMFNSSILEAYEVNSLEEVISELQILDNNTITLDFEPFEIKTIKLYPSLK